MSLLTRLWLSVILATLLALVGSFVLSVVTARGYLTQQLYAQSSDSAASLALSMSQQSKDAAMSELMVSALFDSGHFEAITYKDMAGHVIVERHNSNVMADAPAWFVGLVPLKSQSGEALVSDGWKQAGKVDVRASTRYAYGALWHGALELAAMLAVVGLLLGSAVTLLMRWAWRPLGAIVNQAEAIGKRNFVTVPVPHVKEMRVVAHAMNGMVARVQAMFAEQAARMDQLRNDANRDPLTQLPNRGLFMGRLRHELVDDTAAPAGALIVFRIIDLADVNRRLGRARADALIQACTSILNMCASEQAEAESGRLNGAEFALLMPNADAATATTAATQLSTGFDNLYRREYTDQQPVAVVGWTLYKQGENASEVLLRVDNALMQAESSEQPLTANADVGGTVSENRPAIHVDDWRHQIDHALENRDFELVTYPVTRCDGSLLHQEAMLRMLATDGQRLSAGQFMPVAMRLGRTADLDLLALQLALTRLESTREDVAVNISPLSLEHPGFLTALDNLLDLAGGKAGRLWLELSERGLGEEAGLQAVAALSNVLTSHGCKLGIEHFGRHFAAMPRLHAVRLDYLKLDGGFVADIDTHEGNQRFVKTVVDVAGSLDIRVIAERVMTDSEWRTLAELGVSGVTGPAVTKRLKHGE
ncbi:MAG TPA: EAL domain-containing protein [Rhodocyclaceae bacterium]|nr:EAL domain-containing protein [Rhodocyclaceae bacterium]